MYSIQIVGKAVNGTFLQQGGKGAVEHLVYDSRRIPFGHSSLFFALITAHGDGHKYLAQAYQKGVRNFIVQQPVDLNELPESNVVRVGDTLSALQDLAAYHRSQFSIPVIGITGSNGKTVVKEWLYQLLQADYNIVRSPKSYNSQIGVPLSVWQMRKEHTLAIFEAGISRPGEMEKLEKIIRPTIGIVTNIGEAHSEGFSSLYEKEEEKVKLIREAELIIFCREAMVNPAEREWERRLRNNPETQIMDWSSVVPASLIVSKKTGDGKTILTGTYKNQSYNLTIPFTDEASIQNTVHCWCVMIHLGYDGKTMNERFAALHAVDMRLQLKHGINHCLVINDSYSADISSLRIALDFLQQQSSGLAHTVILSDFYESGKKDDELYGEISSLLFSHRVKRIIGIGDKIGHYLKALALYSDTPHEILSYKDTDEFIATFKSSAFSHEAILIKGARKFHFERIVQLFEQKVHQTQLEINLNAIAHNLKEYQKVLKPGTKVMAMVKAFAYGSGGAEIAGVLQYHNADYLAVAYADEGVELRKAGIALPIMVMNADESTFFSLTEHNLQPVIYAWPFLHRFEQYLSEQALQYYPVHLEMETGMNRLGFSISDTDRLGSHLNRSELIKIESVFSHLAASEDSTQDQFTLQQASLLNTAADALKKYVRYSFLKHIANSAAIVRHPQLQMDMVRLGIGLYGIEIAAEGLQLLPAATLRSTVAQIKHLKAGETVSYNRRGTVKEDSVIATVRIGYADGYSRRFSNGVGQMFVNGKLAPVIGLVCMDMTMINVTGIPNVKEGDEVIIFGDSLPVEQMASWVDSIPYEIMTAVSQRVKRIYFQE